MTKVAALAFALAVSTGCDAFVAPTAPMARTQASSRTVMSAEKSSSSRAAAAVIAAGMFFQGAICSPVQAEQLDVEVQQPTTLIAGFGQPNALDDSRDNNAASGRGDGPKYDVQQQGSFSKKYSGGNAADYGSAKGTDFGPTAGNNPNAASNTKGTAGPFREDAERPENQGEVDIAKKNTRDAANVDVKSVAKNPNAATVRPGKAGEKLQDATNTAANVAKKATSGSIADIFSSNKNRGGPTDGSDPGAGFGFGVTPSADKAAKGPADNVRAEVKNNGGLNAKAGQGPESIGVTAQNPADGLKNAIAKGKNIPAAATGAVSEKGDQGRNVATSAAKTAADKVSNANSGGAGGAAQNVASSASSKVQGDINNLKGSVSSVKGGIDSSAASNAAGSLKDQLKNDGAAVGQPSGKAGGFFDDAKGQQDKIQQKTADKVKSDVNSVTSNLNLSLGNLGGEVNQAKNDPQGKATKDLQNTGNKVKSDVETVAKNTPKAGGFFENPREQQETVREKTVDKVKSDVNSVTSNLNLSLGNLGGEVNQAKNDPQGKATKDLQNTGNKVKSDVETVAKNAPKAGGFFENPRDQQETVREKTVDKVKSDIGSVSSNLNLSGINLFGLGGEANQAKNNPVGKAQKDLNNVGGQIQNKGAQVGQPSGEMGGFLGKNSDKQAQETGSKTVNKVGQDINEAKKAVESARNTPVTTQFSSSINLSGIFGGEAQQAKNNPVQKAQKDLSNVGGQLQNKGAQVGQPSGEMGGFLGKNSDKQAQETGSKTVNKVGQDINEAKKAVESARNTPVTTQFSS